ncbi:MAG: LptA/OstA family protein [Pseudomonadota bacterium]
MIDSIRTSTRHAALYLGLLYLALLPPAIAQLSDSDEDIIYSADGGGNIMVRDGIRVTTLQGNVEVRQGGTHLFGDTATLEQDADSGDIIRVTVEGSPARFARDAAEGRERITGHSQTLIYSVDETEEGAMTVIRFVGDATFNSGRTALRCAEIRHLPESGDTLSTGPCSGTVAPGDL